MCLFVLIYFCVYAVFLCGAELIVFFTRIVRSELISYYSTISVAYFQALETY